MAAPGGLEPPTTAFVAHYSIQLSYGAKNLLPVFPDSHRFRYASLRCGLRLEMYLVMWAGFEPATLGV